MPVFAVIKMMRSEAAEKGVMDRRQRDAGMIQISSQEMRAWIAAAGTRYLRTRFEQTGQVCQVRLGEGDTFLGEDSRSADKTCGGFGLINEFMPSDQGTYEAAVSGSRGFLKIGVGVLQRISADAYSQKKDYPILIQPEITESSNDSSYTATLIQPDFHGYSYLLGKTVSIENHELKIRCRLRNTGEKKLSFCEYAHNFYRLGRNSEARDYRMKCSLTDMLPYEKVLRKDKGLLRLLPFTETSACELMDWKTEDPQNPFSIALINPSTGMQVAETIHAGRVRSSLWCLRDAFCPELIVALDAEPGTEIQWERIYTFGQKKQ